MIYSIEEVREKFSQVKHNLKDGKDKDLIFDVVSCLVRGGMPQSSIMGYLENMAIICDPITITQETRELIEKTIEICTKDKRAITLAQQVRDFVMSTNGHFSSKEIHNCLNLSTRRDKKNVSEILRKLVKDEIIEKYGAVNGVFRKINTDLEKIDWRRDPGEEMDLILPLGLNKLVKIYPKNLIVIAGMSNAGKTALLLNVVGLNLDRFKDKINYFSSEMGSCELSIRLKKFKLGDDAWDGCKFYERSDNFSDIINPDGINIIDYFEINDNFWQIGHDFKKIHDKLISGICIIAIQKNAEKETGRGGTFSIEKPRLYLSLDEIGDYNELKIIKGKNWRDENIRPGGLIKHFKIKNGYQLIELGNWHRDKK